MLSTTFQKQPTSRILEAFIHWEKPFLNNRNEEITLKDVASYVSEKAKEEFNSIRHETLTKHLFDLTELLKTGYIDPAKKTKTAQTLYKDLNIDHLLVQSRKNDDLLQLRTTLKPIETLASWRQLTEKTEDEREDKNQEDNLTFNPHRWLPYHLQKIVKKAINPDNIESIASDMICMIYKATKSQSNDYWTPWFEKAISLFKTHTPQIFNSAVLVYFTAMLMKEHPQSFSNLENEEATPVNIDFSSVPSVKAFYRELITLVILNKIEGNFCSFLAPSFGCKTSNTTTDNNNHCVLNASLLSLTETYFHAISMGRTVIRDFLLKNQHPSVPIRKKIFYATALALLSYVSRHNKAAEFINYIGSGKGKAFCDIEWSVIGNSCLNDPSPDEKELLEALKASMVIPQPRSLQFFITTETAIIEREIDSDVNQIFYALRKHDHHKANDLLQKLVLKYDHIDVDFSTFKIDDFEPGISDSQNYVISYLKSCEEQHVLDAKLDIWLSNDVDSNNFEALKHSLQYRSEKNLTISASGVFQKLEHKIQKQYLLNTTNLSQKYTPQDFLDQIKKVAWDQFSCQLGLGNSLNLGRQDDTDKFFQDAYILHLEYSSSGWLEKRQFINNYEFLASAGAHFASEHEDSYYLTIRDDLLNILEKCCQDDKCDSKHCSNKFLMFGITAISILPKQKRKKVIKALCLKAKEVVRERMSITKRLEQETLRIFLSLLLIQNADFDGETLNEIFTIYHRALYPEEIFLLNPMKSDPFLHALLSKYSDAVTSPKLEDNGFPSPFAIYLIATNEALKEKERVSNKRFISIQKDNKELIHLVKELDLENLHNFFETVLILNGITWRLVNRNKNKSTCVDNSIFKTLLEECTNFWDKIQNNIVSNDLLKLTWATQLLLVSFCNILRAYKDEQNNFNEDYQKLMSIAAHADHTQKLHSNGYKAFLEGDSSSEFFMISGAMRYTSLFYEQIDEDKRNKISFLLSDEMIKNYSIWLAEEKHPRFFWLTYRFLSFTNFFEQESKISDKLSDQIMKNMTMITPRERKNYFLSYDNMTDLSVKDILKTFSKMEHGDRFLKCFDELASQ